VILPVSIPINEFTILKVEAGKNLCVSSFILYTVTPPVVLLNIEKDPSTFAESKYFFRLLSIFALLTVHPVTVINMIETVIELSEKRDFFISDLK
jgi:hypothetical protein